ncbi:MAG: thioredoxin family protein, partial [Candidatus Bathyarchaeia archaeon]
MEILLFSSRTCVHCRVIERFLHELSLDYRKFYVDDVEGFDAAQEYGVLAVPTLVVKADDGSVHKIVGLPQDFRERIMSMVG